MSLITLADLKNNEEVTVLLTSGTKYLSQLGFTEHGVRHASIVADLSYKVLEKLNYDKRSSELAGIAGYMHDIGNFINRYNHCGNGALIAYNILSKMGMRPDEIALVISAIGNHEEERGNAINHVASALILADKSDVQRTRVTNKDFAKFEIHDRVNYAVEKSQLLVNSSKKTVTLNLVIDTRICPVMEYFEIFLVRMIMCRRAAEFLGCHFELIINDNRLL
jgi:metal-dependent HD superfamily phosphatase/phosphodiesterase